MRNRDLKERAKEQLDYKIFGNFWLTAMLVCLIYSGILTIAGMTAIGAIIVSGPLLVGLNYCFVKQARDRRPMKFSDLFYGFNRDLSGSFMLGLMETVYTLLWTLLFIIPGIVKSYAYSMATYIKADYPDYTWRQCLEYSQKMMAGYKWKLFCLDLSFIGWYIVGSICLGIGVFWVVPYHEATKAHFYATLLEQNGKSKTEENI